MKNFEEREELADGGDEKSVAEFYAGKSIFITGGTGFLGKALIEKLLYSCEDIDNIFILIRGKNGVSVEERLQQMFDKPIFTRIIRDRPQVLKKIIPILGDITEPSLGISAADEKTLIEKVSVVFHAAATVKLHEKLDKAVNTNVKGTESVLNLCQRIKTIKAFVHVSTAYCNTDHKVLEEKVYPPRAELDEVLKYMKQPYRDERQVTDKFLKSLPNMYSFTKNLTENYLAEHCRNIPTTIIRPSIVSPSLREPLKGWTDNWLGGTGLIVASAQGVNRVLLGDGNNIVDIIPVDYVTNVAIVAAAKCSSSNTLTVYNCGTSSCNPVSIQKFIEGVKTSAIETGFDIFSHKKLIFTNNKCILFFLTFLLQLVPAYIADLFMLAMGKKPKYVKLQSRVIFGRSLLNYYTSHSWEIKANNVKSLHASLSYSDKSIFPCDPSHINWDQYTATFLNGVKRYLMKL